MEYYVMKYYCSNKKAPEDPPEPDKIHKISPGVYWAPGLLALRGMCKVVMRKEVPRINGFAIHVITP